MEAMASVLRSVVVVVMVMVAMVGSSWGYDFYVGGKDGWVQHPSESYNHWAERNRFQVNDRLVFKYKPGEDSVLLVTKEDFDACDTSKPIQRFDNGDSVSQLDRSGAFFFISGAPGRCQGGQKLVVVVLAVRHKATSPPPPTAAPAPPAVPSAAPSTSPTNPAAAAPPTEGPPSRLAPAPAPAKPSKSSATAASSGAVALVLALGGGAFLLW